MTEKCPSAMPNRSTSALQSESLTHHAVVEIQHCLDLFFGISKRSISWREGADKSSQALIEKADLWRDLEIALTKCGLGDTQYGLIVSVNSSSLGIMAIALTAGPWPWDHSNLRDIFTHLSRLTNDLEDISHESLLRRARTMRILEIITSGLFPLKQIEKMTRLN